MRATLMTILLTIFVGQAPAYALQANDTMKAWKSSSADERAELLGQILGKSAGAVKGTPILKCLDETSDLTGHSELTINEVAKFCATAKDPDQPV